MPKVSIIIPCLNSVKYVREMLESVVNQTLKEIEILIIDAGSTDGTLEIFQEYAAKDGRIKKIHSDRKSMGYQYNIGMDAATSEYIGFVESDDYVDLNMFEELYSNIHGQNLDLVKADFEEFFDLPQERQFTTCKLLPENGGNLYGKIINVKDCFPLINGSYHWNGIYSKDFINRNNIRFNETSGAAFQDYSFYLLTMLYSERIKCLNRPFYKYRTDNGAASAYNPNAYKFMMDEFRYFCKCLEISTPKNLDFFEVAIYIKFFNNFNYFLMFSHLQYREYDAELLENTRGFIELLRSKYEAIGAEKQSQIRRDIRDNISIFCSDFEKHCYNLKYNWWEKFKAGNINSLTGRGVYKCTIS